MSAGGDLMAARAFAAALVVAEQRGSEGPRGDRSSRAGRPGEEPGMRQAAPSVGRRPQLLDDGLLPG